MDTKKDDQNDSNNQLENGESLEFEAPEQQPQPEATVITPESDKKDTGPVSDATSVASKHSAATEKPHVSKKESRFGRFWHSANIYLLLFFLLLLVAGAIVAVLYFKRNVSTDTTGGGTISQQKLSSDALDKLATNGVQVGDPKQVLNVQSNAVFAGQVLVKGELQVAGGLKIGGGDLTLPGLNVGGSAIINDLQTKSLAIAGDTSVQGQLTVGQNLSVGGNGNFRGTVTAAQINTNKLQIVGDFQLTRHLVAGGGIPGRSNGNALGSGGTSSLSGSDTAGTIAISTGSGAGAGCFITVNFVQAFTSTPHVVVTPVGSAAGSIDYYINRSANNFSVCTSSPPPSNSSFGFDYIALD